MLFEPLPPATSPNTDSRPHTTLILAMSADGKISDRGRSPARFGSAADQAHLEAQVALADAVLFGAGTLRAYGTTMSVRDEGLRAARQQRGQAPQPIQMVCSASGELDPGARFFAQAVPRWLLTTSEGAQRWQATAAFERVWTVPLTPQGAMDWPRIGRSLAQQAIGRVAVLGGGQLTAALLAAGLVDEIWLTVCPLVLGGATAPTPVDGAGFWASQAPRLQLLSVTQNAQEVFLHYRLLPPELAR